MCAADVGLTPSVTALACTSTVDDDSAGGGGGWDVDGRVELRLAAGPEVDSTRSSLARRFPAVPLLLLLLPSPPSW